MYFFKPYLWLLLFGVFQIGILKASNNDLHLYQLKGKVRSVRTYTYQAMDSVHKGSFYKTELSRYNGQGNLTAVEGAEVDILGRSDDTSYSHTEFKYDSLGRLVQQMDYIDSPPPIETIKKYNRMGIAKEEYFYANNVWVKWICKYDRMGNLAEKRWQATDSNKYLAVDTYKYDANGNEIFDKYINKLGVGYLIKETKYNEHGAISQILLRDPWSAPTGTGYIYTGYDATGNWLSRTEYIADNPAFIEERVIEYY